MITNGAAMRQITATNRDWYQISNKADSVPEVFIYGEIGWDGVTADDLIRDLAAVDADNLTVRINSPGGSVFGGVAIYNALRTHKAHVTVLVDSIAASVASVIAQAGDTRRMVQHSQMMIHEANGIAIGSGSEMRDYAELLDKQTSLIADVYATRSGKPASMFKAMMTAETWFTADEAVAAGLADDVLVPKQAEPENVTTADPQNVAEPEIPEPEATPTDFTDLFTDRLTHNPFAELLNQEAKT